MTCANNLVLFEGLCVDQWTVKLDGCLSFMYINPNFICLACKINHGFYMDLYANCLCPFGFLGNPDKDICEEICGDGYAYKDKCDDGNRNNYDGCNNLC